MNREDIHKLLGGYATGTLTPGEQQVLFDAALEDQELFDALAREQSLRDLLRDPAAKAQVLAALDTAPARLRWWRPAAVAVAMAGIAVVAVVAVRYWSPAQPPVTVAFVKPPAPAVGQASRPVRQARRPAPLERDALQRQLAPPPAPAVTSPAPAEPAVVAALRKDEAAPLPPPPAQQAAPAPYVQQFAGAASLDGTAGNLSTLNARLLFYGNAPAQAEKKSAVQVDSVVSPAPNLGVRWSILRKQPGGEFAEVGPETVLDSGEAVRLKLVPNNHGRLSVWEAGPNGAWRPIGSGPAEPLQPFETPLAGAEGPGPRQLYVLFTRSAGVGGLQPPSLLTQARTNLTQTSADVAEKATYVVNRVSDPAAGQLIVPIAIQYK